MKKQTDLFGMTIMIFAILFTGGCAGTANIQKALETGRDELKYVPNSERIVEKNGGTVSIGSFVVDDVLPPDTTVTRTSSFILPLFFVNQWKHEFQCKLGYTQIANDYKQFMRESLMEEVKRGSKFAYKADRGDLTLDMTIKKVEINAPIIRGGQWNFLVYIITFGTYFRAGPVDVDVHADVALKKKGVDVLKGEFHGKYKTVAWTQKTTFESAQALKYTATMISGLSMAIKDMNEQIVKAINSEVGVPIASGKGEKVKR